MPELINPFSKYSFKALKSGEPTKTQKKYNTRIAPSPTGHAHIGTFRTALFNYLAAKASGGMFVLRIDDTDVSRNDQKAIRPIKEALKWLGLNPDYSFHQSERLELYRDNIITLVNKGFATVLDNGAIALKWTEGMPLEWTDNIAGPMKVTPTNIEQIDGRLILMTGKDKGYRATYQFASTYDDWKERINYIIRGTDHISNTPKQLAIWYALSQATKGPYNIRAPYPEFAHLGLIFKDGKKLSKRDGAASVLEWRDKGFSAEALNSFMLRLGWAPKEDNKANDLLDMNRAQDMFLTEGKMRNSSANMDVKKLESYERKVRAKYDSAYNAANDRWALGLKDRYDAMETAPAFAGTATLNSIIKPSKYKLPEYMARYISDLHEYLANERDMERADQEDEDVDNDMPVPPPLMQDWAMAPAMPEMRAMPIPDRPAWGPPIGRRLNMNEGALIAPPPGEQLIWQPQQVYWNGPGELAALNYPAQAINAQGQQRQMEAMYDNQLRRAVDAMPIHIPGQRDNIAQDEDIGRPDINF